jgi:hypothetical protein
MLKHRAHFLVCAALSLAILSTGCGGPTAPAPVRSLTISTPTPAPGGVIPTIQRGIQYFVDRQSGQFSVPITITSDREVPFAQLYVYLYTADGTYCGQNLPDTPSWGPYNKGQTVSVAISGFQISRPSCDVTSIRAWLHTRNSGLLTPPTVSETVADGMLSVNYRFAAVP